MFQTVTTHIPVTHLWTVLSALLFAGIAVLIGWMLTKNMQSKHFKTDMTWNLLLSGLFSLGLFLRFGMTIWTVQGIVLFFILLYASCSDLTTHTMDDCLWVMVGILGLLSVWNIGFPSMLTGALMVFVPQVLIALLPPQKALGGADIKMSTALAFLLGWQKGLLALILGLLIAVIMMSIVRRTQKKKQPFALIPFLSVAALAVFVI